MSIFHMMMRIKQDSLRELCNEMSTADGETFDGKSYLSCMQSLKTDSAGNEWVSFKLGKRFTFEPIFNDYGVSEWLGDEPISELCPDTLLIDLITMMGSQYEIVTVWKAHYDTSYDYNGGEDCELELELIGEVDGDKLPLAILEGAY